MTYVVECIVKYSYICEHCGIKTEEFESKLWQETEVPLPKGSRFDNAIQVPDPAVLEKYQQIAFAKMRQLVTAINKIFENTENNEKVYSYIAEQFNELFSKAKSCPECKHHQTWYPVETFGSSSRFHGLKVLWGKIDVELAGAPQVDEVTSEEPQERAMNQRIIKNTKEKKEDLAYWHIRGQEHINLLYVQDVQYHQDNVFSVKEEIFESNPFSVIIEKGFKESDFQDYMIQLCDALEFLHTLEPCITHNKVLARNVLVGKGHLVKLSHFDEASVGESPDADIAMLGELMSGVKGSYIKYYKNIIENCNGVYKSIDDLRTDMTKMSYLASRNSITGGVISGFVAITALVALILLIYFIFV